MRQKLQHSESLPVNTSDAFQKPGIVKRIGVPGLHLHLSFTKLTRYNVA